MCILLMSLLMPAGMVYANSAPPPAEVWFEFKDGEATVAVVGLQLLGCEDNTCAEPVLLQQYGACDSAECLKTSPHLTDIFDAITCSTYRCRAMSSSYKGRPFRLVAQFSDGARTSDVLLSLPVKKTQEVQGWVVQLEGDRLAATPLPNFKDPQSIGLGIENFLLFLKGAFLTFVSELFIAALYFWLRLHYTRGSLLANFGMIAAIEAVTLPMVWLFFPRLSFDPLISETFDLYIPLIFTVAVAMFVWISRASSNNIKLILGVFTALLLPVICYLSAMMGSQEIRAFPLSYEFVIVLAELFAVTAEMVLIYVLRKGEIRWRHAAELSLLMNTSSFLLGLLVLGVWW